MVTRIPQRELRNNNADILNRVEAGERFVVTRNGVAVADVIPHVDHGAPPMFPKTRDLTLRRQLLDEAAPDLQAWLRDIRADGVADDDPLNTRG